MTDASSENEMVPNLQLQPFFHPLSLHQSTSAVLKHVSPLSSTMTVLSMNYVVMAGTVGLITERLLCVSCRWVACRSV